MPLRYFADAWFFIANIDRSDSHHSAAARLARTVGPAVVVCHDAVLSEVLAFFSAQGATLRRAAVTVVRHAMVRMRVVSPDRLLFARALELYEKRPDKEYSLTDCMSMVLMREFGIHHVLSNDHHFSQEGFTLVNA